MDHAPGNGAGSEIGGEAAAMRFAPAGQKKADRHAWGYRVWLQDASGTGGVRP